MSLLEFGVLENNHFMANRPDLAKKYHDSNFENDVWDEIFEKASLIEKSE